MKFEDIYGYKVTEKPHAGGLSIKDLKINESFYYSENESRIQKTRRLKKEIKNNPDNCVLYNYLFAEYIKGNKMDEALRIAEETCAKFPNYFFGKMAMIQYHGIIEDFNKVNELLERPRNILNITSNDYIHVTMLIAYYGEAVKNALCRSDLEEAKEMHKVMWAYDPEHAAVEIYGHDILSYEMSNMFKLMESPNKRTQKEEPRFISLFGKKTIRSKFNHEIINHLYDYNGPFDQRKMENIVSLPLETLIEDLEMVLLDSIERFDYLNEHEIYLDGAMNAIALLAYLKSSDSLNKILDQLRCGSNYLDFHYGDYLDEVFIPSIIYLGHDRLDLLKDFLSELNIFGFSKSIVFESLANIAILYPEKNEKVLNILRGHIQECLDNPTKVGLADATALSAYVCTFCEIKEVSTIGQVKELFNLGWLAIGFCGTKQNVIHDICSDIDNKRVWKLPTSLKGFYERRGTKDFLNPSGDDQKNVAEILYPNDPHEKYLNNLKLGMSLAEHEEEDNYDFWEPSKPIVRVPKNGRNDPCLCGSGKKYKKCCLNKQ